MYKVIYSNTNPNLIQFSTLFGTKREYHQRNISIIILNNKKASKNILLL
jgi:hypothetical protein